jgi:uncharacterized protein (TIGR03000 family)
LVWREKQEDPVMFRNNLSTLSLTAVAAAVCLWTTSPVNAQHHGGGFHAGGFHGGGAHTGGFHAGGFRTGGFENRSFHGGFENRGFHGGFYPWIGGYGWGGYPGYYASPSYYSGGGYPSYYYSPDYTNAPTYDYTPDAYQIVPPVVSTSAYPPSGDTQFNITLTVPENAEVWFDDTKTTQTGRVRHFTTSNLTPGREYSYNIRVRTPDSNGQMMEQGRKVTFRPGDNLNLDFTRNAS